MTYAEYLLSDHWAELRIRAYSVYGRVCEACGEEKFRQVHHTRYRGSWTATKVKDLMVLCRPCHLMVHRRCGDTLMSRADILATMKPQFERVQGYTNPAPIPGRSCSRKAAQRRRRRQTSALEAKWRAPVFHDA